ncbi:nitroreductase family protein [Clostridium butyricum]|uniref:nitroreductase family protein n=1 Tax=Clostridium butyricum TaxID=1492 RepID=UPI0005C151BA|nr:nitroreductase family protein [Clostridium butyricum]KIU04814.1 nitroreductase [Clostridium butyricum]MBA8968811.1 nitroreductase [Clostridium butyricum]MBA8973333.1 nitroreductase [Clostridium butyricum]MBC2426239.1 nitroreductase family protein [Clostridium butyricum]NOW39036.1 nitroreductase [Clostridium butyricum]
MKELFERVSVRKFQDVQVENEKCEQILRAAMAAPSAGNQRPWEFIVVKNKETLEKLSKTSPYTSCLEKAPMAIVVLGNDENLKFPEYWQIDLSAAVENMLLEAVHLGLGGVWLGIAPIKERMDKVAEIFQMPDNLHPFAIIPFGYAESKTPLNDRFELSRVHYEKLKLN